MTDTIRSRRAIRAWTDEDISDQDLMNILESGRWSPSPLNSQPWHFTVVRRKETIEAMCKDAREGAFLRNAKIVIVVSVERKVIPNADVQNTERVSLINWLAEHEQYTYSAAGALQNMWLTTWDMGLGACCVTIERKSTYELLGIPKEHEIIASLALGHILGNPVHHKDSDRKPMTEIISYERYGNKVKQ